MTEKFIGTTVIAGILFALFLALPYILKIMTAIFVWVEMQP